MKRIVLLAGLVILAATTQAAAQTRVSVSIGFGVPLPPVVVVVRRPYARPLLVERVVVTRHPRYHYRPYHRVRACGHHRCGH